MFNDDTVFLVDAEKNFIPFFDSKLIDDGFGYAYAEAVPDASHGYFKFNRHNHMCIHRIYLYISINHVYTLDIQGV